MVQFAADAEPRSANIYVVVDDGVVKLTGMIDDLSERIAASNVALRVAGVSAVVDELTEREK